MAKAKAFDDDGTEVKKERKRSTRSEVVKIGKTEYVPLHYLQKKGIVQGLGVTSLSQLLKAEGIEPIVIGQRRLYNLQALTNHFNQSEV